MPRAKGGPKTRARRKNDSSWRKGNTGQRAGCFVPATESVDKGQQYAYTGPQESEAGLPAVVDRSHQRGHAGAWPHVRPLHQCA